MMTKQASGSHSTTMRRARLSQAIVSGAAVADVGVSPGAAASVIGLSLLPLAPREGEVAEQRGEHEERDHRDGDGRAFAELTAGNAALEGERCHQMGGVHWPAARDGVDELEVGEGED